VSSLPTGSSSASQAKILYTFRTPSTHAAWSAYPVFFNFSILNYLTSRNKYKTVYYVAAGEAGLVVTRLRIRWSMIQIPIGSTDLSSPKRSDRLWDRTHLLLNGFRGSLARVMRPRHEVHHSLPSGDEVKNKLGSVSAPCYLHSWHGQGNRYLSYPAVFSVLLSCFLFYAQMFSSPLCSHILATYVLTVICVSIWQDTEVDI
jgi:hypothetical protein